jgi:hypothetical protein
MGSNSFRFVTNVWLTSIILSPVIFMLMFETFDMKDFDDLMNSGIYLFFFFVFGLLFSSPCWLLLFLFVTVINRQNITLTQKKILVIVVGCLLTYLLFFLLFFDDRTDTDQLIFNVRLASIYCLIISAGITFYKLNPDTTP